MAHTTLSAIDSSEFPQVFDGVIDRFVQKTTEVYDKHIPATDFRVENHGSIFLLRPLTEIAEVWVREFIPDVTYFGSAVAVEHRFIADIVEGIHSAGLEVR